MIQAMDIRLDRKEILIVTVILLLLLAWALGNMSSAYFWIGEDETILEREPADPDYEGSTTAPFATDIPDVMRYVLPIFIVVAVTIGSLLSTSEDMKGRIKTMMTGVALIILIFFQKPIIGFLEYLAGFRRFLPSVRFPFKPDIPFGDGAEPFFSPARSNIASLIILIVLPSLLIIFLFYFKHKRSTDEEADEDDISTTADKAIKQLHEGEDVRDVIIRNYQKMCMILEEEGVPQHVSYTPRELERKAIEKLELKESTIDEMTKLFEKAKYSDHPLGEDQRDRAIKNFEQIKRELEAV